MMGIAGRKVMLAGSVWESAMTIGHALTVNVNERYGTASPLNAQKLAKETTQNHGFNMSLDRLDAMLLCGCFAFSASAGIGRCLARRLSTVNPSTSSKVARELVEVGLSFGRDAVKSGGQPRNTLLSALLPL